MNPEEETAGTSYRSDDFHLEYFMNHFPQKGVGVGVGVGASEPSHPQAHPPPYHRNVFCTNCGKQGHVYKKCTFPVTSVGVLCVSFAPVYFNDVLYYTKRFQSGVPLTEEDMDKLSFLYESTKNIEEGNYDRLLKYMMVQRKHSLCYVDFLRGKYDMDHIEYIQNIFQYMTVSERTHLLQYSFDYLWNELWGGNGMVPPRDYSRDKDYLMSKEKFEILLSGVTLHRNDLQIHYSLEKLVRSCSRTKYETPEWGFPKGRRNMREKNIECARREFEEETNLAPTDYQITNISPMEEVFMGMNNVRYKHIYYVGQVCRKIDLRMDPTNHHMKIEIGNIQWFSYSQALDAIREYDVEKRNLLHVHHHFMKSVFFLFQRHMRELLSKGVSVVRSPS
jgi:8-oxo-dGTP pyrophosphatase MutT (NUDIX family)